LSLSPQAVVNIAVQAAEDKKAEDITVLDIREVSIIADFFLICTGRSSIQVQAIVENIQDKLKEKNYNALRRWTDRFSLFQRKCDQYRSSSGPCE
jgi:ribosome-associated protein